MNKDYITIYQDKMYFKSYLCQKIDHEMYLVI